MENHLVLGKIKSKYLIYPKKDKNFIWFSSVEFRTVEEARRAVEKMHQFEYGGRKLAVKLVRRINNFIKYIFLYL